MTLQVGELAVALFLLALTRMRAATAILTFLYCWNEFLFALSFTLGPERHTVSSSCSRDGSSRD